MSLGNLVTKWRLYLLAANRIRKYLAVYGERWSAYRSDYGRY